ncbi:NAD(P)/FAD-dependent oxidoreductase [Solimonas sp. SE-A11]|uniref:flavin-containing monooxygenase n=1 Tax=Solimonas sp. SE-A11 TaxID=3054954 RepID=UPI00259CB8DF|nr:NAD(P)/FAD-dependent oxidoreductase [Solimonas sp. SE-A11]MDM4769780.1 NAD(P)/FAD-dependent oxidoreductase [Solimonas sp. SE-A11]
MGRAERMERQPDYEAIVIGTGFGGMGAAIELKRQGIDSLLLLDRNDDLGGTWHVNSYPGLAVDIASFTYSYSFEPNPGWTRLYAPGAELKKYAEHVAGKYDLRRHMRFNTVVLKAVWDEANRLWTVHLARGEPLTARLLLTATGFLSQPKKPGIPGIETFKGKVMHTAAWDHDYELQGKRAAVIGTGATAVQLLPKIAPKLARLDVYQRTAIWVTPKLDGPIPLALRRLFAALPSTQRSARLVSSGLLEAIMVTGVLYNKQLPLLMRTMERACKTHIARQVNDPALREKLTPDYSFGCKRPTFSNTYYPTFNRANVELVTDAIERIEPDAIVTRDGQRRPIDTLILATGFSLWEENFPAIQIVGRAGKDLGAWWRGTRFQSYEGIAIPGFPNLFSLNSPYAYNGLSFFTTIEGQMKHIARLLGEMRRKKARSFEVSEKANDAFVADMKRRLEHSVFVNGNCASSRSYYFNPHGEATLLRPTSTVSGLRRSGRFPLKDYQFA